MGFIETLEHYNAVLKSKGIDPNPPMKTNPQVKPKDIKSSTMDFETYHALCVESNKLWIGRYGWLVV